MVERLGPVAGHVHPEPLPLEADGERFDERLLVLDHQDRRVGTAMGSACLGGSDRPPGPAVADGQAGG
jgi:hypothetical protein